MQTTTVQAYTGPAVTVHQSGRGYTVQVGAYTVGEASRRAMAEEIAALLRSDAALRSEAFHHAALYAARLDGNILGY